MLVGYECSPLLGIVLTDDSGQPLSPSPEPNVSNTPPSIPANAHSVNTVTVNLVNSVTIPSQKGRVLKAKVTHMASQLNKELVFEPNWEALKTVDLFAMEMLISREGDEVLVPIDNFQAMPVHLEKGIVLGSLQLIERSPEYPQQALATSTAAPVVSIAPTPERNKQLFSILKLPLSELKPEEADELVSLVEEFSDIFALTDAELGHTDILQHMIDTCDSHPIRQQPYRTPVVRRGMMKEMVEFMQRQGVIQPSCSPWASPVVLVPKKDGSLRFCVDYRHLNAVTKKDVYPLPRVDDLLSSLGGAKYFTSLDLASGYWQVELDEDAKLKSAFTTYNGLYEFVRMPFGLCNTPATFQRLMQKVLAGLEWKSCFVYLDDILIASSFEEHLQHLLEVFARLKSANLRLKPKKCGLLRCEVNFLGHIVSTEGVRLDPSKTTRIETYPRPTTVTEVRCFLGLASYYRRFVAGFATLAAPLHALTKKNVAFEWTDATEDSFVQLRSALTTAPVLAYPRFGPGYTFILETDASTVGLGAVLSQVQEDGMVHPIAYASRAVDKHERIYGISELETLGLIWSVRYFRFIC